MNDIDIILQNQKRMMEVTGTWSMLGKDEDENPHLAIEREEIEKEFDREWEKNQQNAN